jgi:hypothetical protein
MVDEDPERFEWCDAARDRIEQWAFSVVIFVRIGRICD